MNTNTPPPAPATPSTRKFGCLHVLLILIVLLLAAILGSMWWLKRNVYASEFQPVELKEEERLLLDAKLNAVDPSMPSAGPMAIETPPEVYSEDAARRRIVFSQQELNAVLAKDPELAKRVKFNLSDDLVSIHFITPMDDTMPVVGGKTFKFSMGLGLSFTNDKPSVIVRGISLGGIPLPAAWWGDVKNKNLVEAFAEENGFWDLFSKGVEYLEVKNGQFILHLKE